MCLLNLSLSFGDLIHWYWCLQHTSFLRMDRFFLAGLIIKIKQTEYTGKMLLISDQRSVSVFSRMGNRFFSDYNLSIKSNNNRTPNPVPPTPQYEDSFLEYAGPAISICAQEVSFTNSERNNAAVIAPP